MRTFCKGFALFCCVSVSSLHAGTYSGGSGTEADPYQIATKADLLELGATTTDYSSHFIMTADIDLSGTNFTTAVIAPDNDVASSFQGTKFQGDFNGNGHIISNLVINASGTQNDYLGLFGHTLSSSSQIRNLRLINASVSGDSSGAMYAGILCGYLNNTTVTNCSAAGIVSGYYYIGGICGYAYYANFSHCESDVTVTGTDDNIGGFCGYGHTCNFQTCKSSSTTSGDAFIGCFCGYLNAGNIYECSSTGTASGTSNIGGFCGQIYGTQIYNSFSTGSASGSSYVGGFCGYLRGRLDKCYSTGAVAGSSQTGGLCGYNTIHSHTY